MFRRHEGWGAEELAGGGELGGGQFCYAEVGDFGALNAVFFVRGHEDVGWLDVTVDYAVFVGVAEGFGDLLA